MMSSEIYASFFHSVLVAYLASGWMKTFTMDEAILAKRLITRHYPPKRTLSAEGLKLGHSNNLKSQESNKIFFHK